MWPRSGTPAAPQSIRTPVVFIGVRRRYCIPWMGDDVVRYELQDGIGVARLDDGKANVVSPQVIDALNGILDRAEAEAGAVLLVGRDGMLSGGFDLATMRAGPEAMLGLVKGGAGLFARCLEYPRPVVVACTGHAIAAGALLLLAADARIGARGAFKIGLTEVALGMTLPLFAIEMARLRLSKRHFHRATVQGAAYPPDEAVDAGYLDAAVDPGVVFDEAFAEATRLAAFSKGAFAGTKARANAATVALMRDTLDDDMAANTGGR